MKLKENPGVLSFSLKLFAQLVIPINIGCLLPPRTYYAAKLREKKNERKKKERERERERKQTFNHSNLQAVRICCGCICGNNNNLGISWLLTFLSLFKVRINNSEKFYLLSQHLIQNFQES